MLDYPNDQNIRDVQERYHLFAHLNGPIIDAERKKECPEGPLHGLVVGLKANVSSIGANWSAGLRHRTAITAQSDEINARVDGWVFTIPLFKYENLSKRLADFVASDSDEAGPS